MKKFIKKYWVGLPIGILIGGIFPIIIQARIGMTGNQATIYAGIFGFLGGIAGAMGAFFIAKMQFKLQSEEQRKLSDLQFLNQLETMESQLERQFIKDKEKMRIEIDVNNIQNLVQDLSQLIHEFIRIDFIRKELSKDIQHKVLVEYLKKYDKSEAKILELLNKYSTYSFLYPSIDDYKEFHTPLVRIVSGFVEVFNEIKFYEGNLTEKNLEVIEINIEVLLGMSRKEIEKFQIEMYEKLE